jgi:flagellar protein FliO/FliZ
MLVRLLQTFTLCAAFAASAAGASETPTPLPMTPGIGGADIASLGLSLFVVIGVIVALGWLYSRSRFMSGGGADLITIVASRALGPKERLLVIEVGEQQILVGMTATSANTLHVLEKPIQAAEKTPASGSFAARLKSALLENSK